MKTNLLAIATSLLLVSGTTFAAKNVTVIKNPTFAPVAWHATLSNGGFGLENQTNKTQYVQVTIQTGEIHVFVLNGGKDLGTCKMDLTADIPPYSGICELAPTDVLVAELDMSKMGEATGTYQIEM